MKLRAPPNASGPISHKGAAFDIAADGAIEVPDSEAEALSAHGCRPWLRPVATDAPLEAMSRSELIMRVMDMTMAALKDSSTDDIRARLVSVQPEAAPLPDEARADGIVIDPLPVTAQEIEAMNRPALFAFLRARQVPVCVPIKNDELRQLAQRAIEEVV